jgi:hypothetical protein
MDKRTFSILSMLGMRLCLLGTMTIDVHAMANDTSRKDKKTAQTATLTPFGLDSAELNGAKIFIAVYTPKTGMGKEQLEISGDGTVTLTRSANYKAPDQNILGKVEPGKVAALLGMFEAEGFMDLERTYSTNSTIKITWQMKLTLPKGEKQVFAEAGSTPPQFDRLMGAVRLLAGMGAPQSLGKQFFFHL